MKIQDTLPFSYSLLESSSPGPFKVRGLFARYDEKNANGRIYTRALWEKVIESVKQTVSERAMIGEIDHPAVSEVKLKEGAFLITGLSLLENGEVHGELEVLDNPHGKQLESYFKAGARVGISSRGEGSVTRKESVDYIGEDYQLLTFDIVSNPSTRGAFPRVVMESTTAVSETSLEPTPMIAEKFAALQARVREIGSVNLSETTTAHRAEIEKTIQETVQSLDRLAIEDPSFRSASGMLVEDLKDFRKKFSGIPTMETKTSAASNLAEAAIKRAQKESAQRKAVEEKAKGIIRGLRQENAQLRTAYGLSIKEGEKVLAEKNALIERYELAIALGQGLTDRFTALKESLKAKTPKVEAKKAAPVKVVETKAPDKVRATAIKQKVEEKKAVTIPAAKKVALVETVQPSVAADQFANEINGLNLQF